MTTARQKQAAEKLLLEAGMTQPLAYQPQHLFRRNGRKLDVAERDDPWRVAACHGGRFYHAIGDDPAEGAREIIRQATFPKLHDLAGAVEALAGALARIAR